MQAFFSTSWEESRSKFIAAARRAGATLTTLEHDIDVAVVENGPGVVLVSSGVHGVEGYAGSAIQIACFAHATCTCVFVHGLNAHGMQQFRRWTANNVDLNRNGAAPDESPLYRAVSPFLNVDKPESALSFYASALYYIARYGFSALKQAVAGGQISTPGGLFFAGTSREPCLSVVLEWLEARFPVIDVHIDVHTGLGSRGRDTIIVDDKDSVAPMLDDTCVIEVAGDGPTAYKMRGTFIQLTKPRLVGLMQEFGTEGPIAVLHALRNERALLISEPNAPIDHPIRQRLRDVFYPSSDAAWQAAVLARGRHVFSLACTYASRKSS